MDAVETWASSHGLERITLDTGAANAGARAFYGRLGFGDEEVTLTDH
ncbi:MAG: GNAT family N-acetyltransferase [Mycobacteriales bacterium]